MGTLRTNADSTIALEAHLDFLNDRATEERRQSLPSIDLVPSLDEFAKLAEFVLGPGTKAHNYCAWLSEALTDAETSKSPLGRILVSVSHSREICQQLTNFTSIRLQQGQLWIPQICPARFAISRASGELRRHFWTTSATSSIFRSHRHERPRTSRRRTQRHNSISTDWNPTMRLFCRVKVASRNRKQAG